MDIISSMLSVLKNVGQTDRSFKILKDKLVFHIKKAETVLKKYQKERHIHSFIRQNLQKRLNDAREKLVKLQTLIPPEQQKSISIKDKIKLSLPFNNQRDKINEIIEDLRQAIEELINNDLPVDPATCSSNKKKAQEKIQDDQHLDKEIDQLYEMGPTIQQNNALNFAQQFTKNHTVELKIQILGNQSIIQKLDKSNKLTLVERTCERISKQSSIELYKLGRLNFRNQYKSIKPLYPDIDKISKIVHFRVIWKRPVPRPANSGESKQQEKLQIDKKSVSFDIGSQKKEEVDQFFSVPEVDHGQFMNGTIVIQKENKVLFRRVGNNWVKIQQQVFEVANGDELAIGVSENVMPDMYFKISFAWK